MKRQWLYCALIVIVFLNACNGTQPTEPPTPRPSATPTAETSAQHVMLASTEFPPYNGKDLPGQGVLTEIVVTAYEHAGYTASVKFMPWARALEEAKSGEYDAVFSTWYRPEREEWFWFSDPILPNEMGFYKRSADDITYDQLEDLAPYVIGTVRGYAYPPEFSEADYLQFDEVTDDATNLRKLYHERIDLIIIDRGMAQYLIDTQFPEYAGALEWMEPAIETLNQYVAFSKAAPNSEKKLADFNAGLQAITEDGTLQEILERHGFQETP